MKDRTVILPQLGAPGVAAHHVGKLSGFRAIYGPIRARDLPAFLDSGLKATPEMRRKTFEMGERLPIIPAATSYLAMNFTGPSTYTSLSGVRKEMRWAVPLQIAAVLIGTLFWLKARF